MNREARALWEKLKDQSGASERVEALSQVPSMIRKFYSKLPHSVKVHIGALYLFVKNEPLKKSAPALAALLYFVMPLDVMPDFLPLLGFADDIAVIQFTLRYLHREIQPYLKPAEAELARWESQDGEVRQEGSDNLH